MPRTKTTWPKSTGSTPPKRGPTGKHAQKNPPDFIEPTDVDLQPVVQRWLCGEGLQSIGRSLGVSKQAINQRIRKWALSGKADKSYQDLVTEVLVTRIADADQMLEDALSMLDVTRAEKAMRYTRMDFERRRPHLYGQRAEITFTGPAAIFLGLAEPTVQLAGNGPKLIELPQPVENHDIENAQDIDN